MVVSVSADGHTLSLVKPLDYTHYGITEFYDGGEFIEIR